MRRQIAARLLAALLAAAAMPPAAAEKDAFALFEQFISKPAITLNFQQTSYDRKGTLLNATGGMLAYQRPDKFRLQYNAPGNPLIISDGSTVWLYEEELQQVVTQPFAGARKSGLWQVLFSGDIAALKKNYVVSAGIGGELRWLTAETLDDTTDVRQIGLGFDGASGELRQVHITDHFDSTVKMHIDEVEYQVSRPGETFSFTPPEGSEIIHAE